MHQFIVTADSCVLLLLAEAVRTTHRSFRRGLVVPEWLYTSKFYIFVRRDSFMIVYLVLVVFRRPFVTKNRFELTLI